VSWTVESSGTQTADGSENTLVAAATTNATYCLLVDLTNMTNGDIVELRIYTKVLSGGALDLAWKGTYAQAPLIVVAQSPFVPSDQSFKATLKQVAGTNRNYDWKVLRA
jgi:hypothetical protein